MSLPQYRHTSYNAPCDRTSNCSGEFKIAVGSLAKAAAVALIRASKGCPGG